MTRIRQIKTNFTAGEVTPSLLGRGDLRAYDNGALSLRNVFIHPTGGVSRRAGLYYFADAVGPGRLVPFEFSTEQTYLLVFSHERIDIIDETGDPGSIVTLAAPWTAAQLPQLSWTQSADTLLLCHPDVPPRRLTRNPNESWLLSNWVFASEDFIFRLPFYRYAATNVTVTPSVTTGSVTLTASAAVFDPGHLGTRLWLGPDTQAGIANVASPTVVDVNLFGADLPNTEAIKHWQEQAFSAVRGWPISATFHQDRLVIGGSKSLPNRLWFSKTGDIWNFDLGTGLDDEAIEFPILSDQVNAIRALFSGRNLQVFTSGAEWMVSGSPLTPGNVQINRQTRIGSITQRQVPPVDVDGATVFAGRNGNSLREFLFADVEQAYRSGDLVLLAPHLFKDPVDQAFDPARRLLVAVLGDGGLATLTLHRNEAVLAWARQDTAGTCHAVAVSGGDTFVLVERAGVWTVEVLDDDVLLDSALTGSAAQPVTSWSGLDHLEGRTVGIVADGAVQADKVVSGGAIELDAPAKSVAIGLPYTHLVEPLPPSAVSLGGDGRAHRVVEAIFRVEQTQALSVDSGGGLKDIALRRFGPGMAAGESPPVVSGDIAVPAFGWRIDGAKAPWRIEQSAPLPFTLLSATLELKVND